MKIKYKNNILFEQRKNNKNIFLLFSKKQFLITHKTQKNKNIPPFPNKFYVSNNRKQFL